MSRRRPALGDVIKDIAVKLAREAERYVGAQDATACRCGHERSAHCGCGSVCLAPEKEEDKGTGRTCQCAGFSPKVEG